MKDSILLKAHKIVNGDRNEQYGDPLEAFSAYSNIALEVFGIEVSPVTIAKIMIAVKLGRLKYKWKEDSAIDVCGYMEILNQLLED